MLLIRIGFQAMSDTVVAQARGNTGNVGAVPVSYVGEKDCGCQCVIRIKKRGKRVAVVNITHLIIIV